MKRVLSAIRVGSTNRSKKLKVRAKLKFNHKVFNPIVNKQPEPILS